MAKSAFVWEEAAQQQLQKAPFFIRKLARSRIEKAARERGVTVITAELVEQVKNKEMKK